MKTNTNFKGQNYTLVLQNNELSSSNNDQILRKIVL